MIRLCVAADFDPIWAIINDGAQAYCGVIPADRLADPYMSREMLEHEIADGVTFWAYESAGAVVGVMGVQPVRDVTLIRHAYVRSKSQGQGVGAHLLLHLQRLTGRPILIGTWADASWAIRFYQRHGFEIVTPEVKDRLLRTYWNIPDRQIETSVVLADPLWRARQKATES